MKPAETAFGLPVQPQSRVDIWGCVAAIVAISAVGVGIGLSFPLLSFLLEARGYSTTVIGANTAMAGLASIAIAPFITPLSRRFGLVNLLIFAAVVAALCLVGFDQFRSIGAWFALRVLFHGALTISFVGSEYWINAAAPPHRRGLFLGIYATVLSCGFAAGPALLATLGTQGSEPFLAGAVIILLSIIPAVLARHRQPPDQGDPRSRSILRYAGLVPVATGAAFIFGAVEQAGLALFPVYGQRTGYNETSISLLLMVLAFGNVTMQIPLGMISDRMRDRRWLLFMCAAIGALGVGILPWATGHPTVLTIGIFLWGGVVAGMYTIGLAHLGSRLQGADLAQANAAFIAVYAVGMVVGPQYAGLMMDAFNPHGFAWSLLSMFIPFLLLVIVRQMLGRGRKG